MAVGPNKKPARKRIKVGSIGAKYMAGKAKAAKRGTDRMTVTDVEKAGKLVGMKKGGKMAKGYAKGGAKMSVAGLRAAAKKMGYKVTKA